METILRLPVEFEELHFDAGEFSNLLIGMNIKKLDAIYNKSLFGRYTTSNFTGLFWWNDNLGYWCMEIWQYDKYVTTYISDSFPDLINEVKEVNSLV